MSILNFPQKPREDSARRSPTRSARPTTPRLPAPADEVARSLYAHRLLSTSQVHRLHLHDRSDEWANLTLRELRKAGLAASVPIGGNRKAWYLTPAGQRVVERSGVERRPYRMSQAEAQGPGQAHLLAVNEAALSFVVAARGVGDDCGPFDWRNETAYGLGGGRKLIVDAVVDYTALSPRGASYLCRFLELDRASMRVADVAAKLSAYAALRSRPEEWAHRHPVFPRTLFVLAGADRPALERRCESLCALSVRLGLPDLGAVVVLLDDLVERGPLAPVLRPLSDPGRRMGLLES